MGLSYATNWQRSALQDALLTGLQPYLITGNWYHEMLPIEWISDSARSRRVRVLIQTSSDSNEWKKVLDATKKGVDRARSERLLHVLAELASNEDTLGLTNLLKSMVVHWEHENKSQKVVISRIRLEKNSEPKPIAADEPTASSNEPTVSSNEPNVTSDETQSVLYEAELARFPDGEFGFVPKIESLRSVRSLKEPGVAK